MGIFGDILKTGFDIATSPIEVAKDAVTLGGILTDEDEPYSVKRLKQIGKDLEDTRDDLEDL